jgi:hypothetical protein
MPDPFTLIDTKGNNFVDSVTRKQDEHGVIFYEMMGRNKDGAQRILRVFNNNVTKSYYIETESGKEIEIPKDKEGPVHQQMLAQLSRIVPHFEIPGPLDFTTPIVTRLCEIEDPKGNNFVDSVTRKLDKSGLVYYEIKGRNKNNEERTVHIYNIDAAPLGKDDKRKIKSYNNYKIIAYWGKEPADEMGHLHKQFVDELPLILKAFSLPPTLNFTNSPLVQAKPEVEIPKLPPVIFPPKKVEDVPSHDFFIQAAKRAFELGDPVSTQQTGHNSRTQFGKNSQYYDEGDSTRLNLFKNLTAQTAYNGLYTFAATTAYGLSLLTYIAINYEKLDKLQRQHLYQVYKNIAGDIPIPEPGKELDPKSNAYRSALAKGLKAEVNEVTAHCELLSYKESHHGSSFDVDNSLNKYTQDLVRGNAKGRPVIDKQTKITYSDGPDTSDKDTLTRTIPAFFPIPPSSGTTDQIVLQAGGCKTHSAIVCIWKQGVDKDGKPVPRGNEESIVRYRVYRTASNAGFGTTYDVRTNPPALYHEICSPKSDGQTYSVCTQEVLLPVDVPYTAENMQKQIEKLVNAERKLNIFHDLPGQKGPNGEVGTMDKGKQDEWRALNQSIRLGPVEKSHSVLRPPQTMGDCSVRSIQEYACWELLRAGVKTKDAESVLDAHWSFASKNDSEAIKRKLNALSPSVVIAEKPKPSIAIPDKLKPSVVIPDEVIVKPVVIIKKVAAHRKGALPADAGKVQLNCPEPILKEFRRLLEGTKIPGSSFHNPYTNQNETFPSQLSQFTARHLQILARNEAWNTDGTMKIDLYKGSLTADKIARLRCLVKATTVAGVTHATHFGGYPKQDSLEKFHVAQKVIVIDQSGLQWQNDLRNTGGMFFYPIPIKMDAEDIPEGYASWQKDMFQSMYGRDRPTVPSSNVMLVNWNKVPGRLDLDQVANAIEVEFRQALDAAVSQGNVSLGPKEKINFKFLKAGMGFFATGLKVDKWPLENARLLGIEQALRKIEQLPEAERVAALGKVGRIELPFSASPPHSDPIINRIKTLVENLNLGWGGTPSEDAFVTRVGFINATTNCADPHAMIGNEGGYSSVDAAIASNADVSFFNPAFNTQIQLRESPPFNPGVSPTEATSLNKTIILDRARQIAAALGGLKKGVLEVIPIVKDFNPDEDNSQKPLEVVRFQFGSEAESKFFEDIVYTIDERAVDTVGPTKTIPKMWTVNVNLEFIAKVDMNALLDTLKLKKQELDKVVVKQTDNKPEDTHKLEVEKPPEFVKHLDKNKKVEVVPKSTEAFTPNEDIINAMTAAIAAISKKSHVKDTAILKGSELYVFQNAYQHATDQQGANKAIKDFVIRASTARTSNYGSWFTSNFAETASTKAFFDSIKNDETLKTLVSEATDTNCKAMSIQFKEFAQQIRQKYDPENNKTATDEDSTSIKP